MAAVETIPGVDVSSFNGVPSQWKGAAGAIRWAAVKITELSVTAAGTVSRYVNPDAAYDWAYLAGQKLGRVAYLFGHPASSPDDTVTFFVQELKALGGLLDADGVMLDLEVTDGRTPAEVDAWAHQVTSELARQLDRAVLVYTYLDFALEGNCASLGARPLWMSDPSSPAGEPRVPAPWKTWTIHQYSTSGAIDRDVAKYPDLDAMRKALGRRQPKPPEDEPMQMVQSVTLADVVTLEPDGLPVTLRWQAPEGSASALTVQPGAAKPGAGVMLSALNIRVAEGSDIRFTLAATDSGGKPGKSVKASFSQGGWTQFTTPFTAAAGTAYVLTAANYGTVPAKLAQGTWEIVR